MLIYGLLSLVCVAAAFLCGGPVFAESIPNGDGTFPMLMAAGTLSAFETRTMLKALSQRKAPTQFLLSTFFKGFQQFDTEHVDIEIIAGDERLAPIVSPVVAGKVMDAQAREIRSFKPAYVKPKFPFKPSDLRITNPGETIYQQDLSPEQRAQQKVGAKLADLDDAITRREEAMAAEALNTGKIHVVGEGVDAYIDFQMPTANIVTLTGTDLWTDAGSDPVADFEEFAALCDKTPDVAVLGDSVWTALRKNDDFMALMDMRAVEMGRINPQQLPEQVTYLGQFRSNGVFVDLYTYGATYTDDEGVKQKFVPTDKLWMGSSRAENKKLYGAIEDFVTAAVPRFPKTWVTEDPATLWVMVQSAPLIALLDSASFVSAKVV
jgi:hypothetical protein